MKLFRLELTGKNFKRTKVNMYLWHFMTWKPWLLIIIDFVQNCHKRFRPKWSFMKSIPGCWGIRRTRPSRWCSRCGPWRSRRWCGRTGTGWPKDPGPPCTGSPHCQSATDVMN
jgi:hypothetical protein